MGRYLYLSIFLTVYVSTYARVSTSKLPSENYKHHPLENEMNGNVLPPVNSLKTDYNKQNKVKADGVHFTQTKKKINSQYGNKILTRNTGSVKTMPGINNLNNVTVLVGERAQLKCMVGEDLWDSVIIWIRERHDRLLTVGEMSLYPDWRISPTYSVELKERILQIDLARKIDSGWYKCKISNSREPSKLIEQRIYLDVVDPHVEASIIGSSEIFIEDGSSLNLTCSVQSTSDSPSQMVWYHDRKWINHNTSNRNIQLQSGSPISTSLIFIPVVSMESAGNYTCSVSETRSANVIVHILQVGHDSGSFLEYLAYAVCYLTSYLCE